MPAPEAYARMAQAPERDDGYSKAWRRGRRRTRSTFSGPRRESSQTSVAEAHARHATTTSRPSASSSAQVSGTGPPRCREGVAEGCEPRFGRPSRYHAAERLVLAYSRRISSKTAGPAVADPGEAGVGAQLQNDRQPVQDQQHYRGDRRVANPARKGEPQGIAAHDAACPVTRGRNRPRWRGPPSRRPGLHASAGVSWTAAQMVSRATSEARCDPPNTSRPIRRPVLPMAAW